jgi:hypothetical protein
LHNDSELITHFSFTKTIFAFTKTALFIHKKKDAFIEIL